MIRKLMGALGILAAGFAGVLAGGAMYAYAGLGTGAGARTAAAAVALAAFWVAYNLPAGLWRWHRGRKAALAAEASDGV